MCVVAIVDFCQNLQLPSHKKDQPGKTYFFVPLNIFVLGVVDCNCSKDYFHAYMYTEAEGGEGGNTVASLIMKYLLDQGVRNIDIIYLMTRSKTNLHTLKDKLTQLLKYTAKY